MIELWILCAFLFGLGARLVGLPPMVGFLVAGFVLQKAGAETVPALEITRDLGVTLLLFTIGLKLRVSQMLRPQIWAGAALHMGLTVAALTGALLGLGALGLPLVSELDLGTAALVAFALSFSSTVFAVKVLDETGESGSFFGRIAIGILIIQDIFAVVFMQLSDDKIPSIWALGLLLLLPARRLLYRIVEWAGHGEMLVLMGTTLALVVGHGLFELVGIKGDFGALLVGALLAPHRKSDELYKSMMGLKDLFLVSFFLDIGISGGFDLGALGLATSLIPLLLLKAIFYFGILTRLRMRTESAMQSTVTLFNFSEFGLIVVYVAVQAGWLPTPWLVVIALAVANSLLFASPLGIRSARIAAFLAPYLERVETSAILEDEKPIDLGSAEILVVGMGRVGVGAYQEAEERWPGRVVGIDRNSDVIERHRAAGRRVIHTELSEWDLSEEAMGQLRTILLTVDDPGAALRLGELIRRSPITARVVSTVRFDDEVESLEKAGIETVCNLYTHAGRGLAIRAAEEAA